MLSGHGADEIDAAYTHITNEIIRKINGVISFGGNELTVIGNQFIVRAIGSKVAVQAPKIKSIDREYIKSISCRAMQDVEQQNFDSPSRNPERCLRKHSAMLSRKRTILPPIAVILQSYINRSERSIICTLMAIPTDESTHCFLG